MSSKKKPDLMVFMGEEELLAVISVAVGDMMDEKIAELQTVNPKQKYVTTEVVCKMLVVSRQSVYTWDKQGILKPFRFGNRKRYRLSDIHDMVEKGYRGHPASESVSKSVNSKSRDLSK